MKTSEKIHRIQFAFHPTDERCGLVGDIAKEVALLEAENERLRKALNLIAVRGEGQDASSFDNYWYSEYAYATAEKALGGE